MKKFKGFLWSIAVLSLTFCLILSNVLPTFANIDEVKVNSDTLNVLKKSLPETIDIELAVAKKHTKRLFSEEKQLDTVVFENEDGTKSAYVFDENIKYEENGTIIDKSNKLTSMGDGYTNTKNDVRVFYPTKINEGINVSYGDYKITMTPHYKETISLSLFETVPKGKPINNIKAFATYGMQYDAVFGENTYVEYVQEYNGFKETIVVEKPTGQTRFSFDLLTDGLILEKKDDLLCLVDPKTKSVVGTLGAIVMWDSNGNYFDGEYKISEVAESREYTITIIADNIVNDSKTVYPIYIDPSMTITVGETDKIQDATIFQNYSSNYGNRYELYVGNRDKNGSSSTNYGEGRTLVKFPGLFSNGVFSEVISDLDYATILSVKYNFAELNCTVGPMVINAYLCNASWNENTVVKTNANWSDSGKYVGSVAIETHSPKPTPRPRYELDITRAVDAWVKYDFVNNGIILVANQESLDKAAVIASREGGNSDIVGDPNNKPYIVFTFTTIATRDNLIYKIKNVGTEKYLNVHNAIDGDDIALNVVDENAPDNDAPDNDAPDDITRVGRYFKVKYFADEMAYKIYPLCSKNGRHRILTKDSSDLIISNENSDVNQLIKLEAVVGQTGCYRFLLKSNQDLALGVVNGSVRFISKSETDPKQLWEFKLQMDKVREELYYANMIIDYPLGRDSTASKNLSSGYFYRLLNGSTTPTKHTGVDIKANINSTLYSMVDGIVVSAGTVSDRGISVVIEATGRYNCVYNSEEPLRFIYMHMNSIKSGISVGSKVKRGDIIGYVGNTGDSQIPHLHLAVVTDHNYMQSPLFSNTIDPILLFDDITFPFEQS